MGDAGSSSSNPSHVNSSRPVVVRVKRKASQSPLEAFWLEINERPRKQPLLDFGKLSLSDTHLHSQKEKDLKNQKVFVQRIETVTSSDATVHILQSFLPHADSSGFRKKVEERKCCYKQGNKQDQLLTRSRQKHELLAKNARFEQIWKSRKEKEETMDDDLQKTFHLYDVVRVDSEDDCSDKKEEPKDTSLEDSMMLYNYLPLVKEFLPSVAEEIHSDVLSYISKQGSADDYLYDVYTVQDDLDASNDHLGTYPLVQVKEEDDFYDGQTGSECETDDSNAEDNPLNDYPDEMSEDEDEDEDEDEEDEDEDEDGDGDEDEDEDEDETESRSSDNQSVKLQNEEYDVEDIDYSYEEEISIDGYTTDDG